VKLLVLTNQALRNEGVWGSGSINPHFPNFGTSWRRVVSFSAGRFTPGERAPVPIRQEAGWAPESVWTKHRRENSCSYRDSNNSDPLVVLKS
jgi:hypothetical protein